MRVSHLYGKKAPAISFEFFPPRNEKAAVGFSQTVADLAALAPDYMSVTFGAGGSTRDGSYHAVKTIMKEHNQPTVAYLAGYGLGPEEIVTVLDGYRDLGVETIFVIRGDKPRGDDFTPHPESFAYASDLIAFIHSRYDFSLGCAGYPEGHLEAQSLEKDIDFLRLKVDNGAQYVVTQYFYDNDFFLAYRDKCRAAGVDVPIVPGIMPVYTVKMTRMLSKVCGSAIPEPLQQRLDAVDSDNAQAVLDLGVEVATEQCRGLLKEGVAGLHFYTMDRSGSTTSILERLRQEKLL